MNREPECTRRRFSSVSSHMRQRLMRGVAEHPQVINRVCHVRLWNIGHGATAVNFLQAASVGMDPVTQIRLLVGHVVSVSDPVLPVRWRRSTQPDRPARHILPRQPVEPVVDITGRFEVDDSWSTVRPMSSGRVGRCTPLSARFCRHSPRCWWRCLDCARRVVLTPPPSRYTSPFSTLPVVPCACLNWHVEPCWRAA